MSVADVLVVELDRGRTVRENVHTADVAAARLGFLKIQNPCQGRPIGANAHFVLFISILIRHDELRDGVVRHAGCGQIQVLPGAIRGWAAHIDEQLVVRQRSDAPVANEIEVDVRINLGIKLDRGVGGGIRPNEHRRHVHSPGLRLMDVDQSCKRRTVRSNAGIPLRRGERVGHDNLRHAVRDDAVGTKVLILPARAGTGRKGVERLHVSPAFPIAQQNEINVGGHVRVMLYLGAGVRLHMHHDDVKTAAFGFVQLKTPFQSGTDRPHATPHLRGRRVVSNGHLHDRIGRHIKRRAAEVLCLPRVGR